jgi:hypothetical protein
VVQRPYKFNLTRIHGNIVSGTHIKWSGTGKQEAKKINKGIKHMTGMMG